MRSEQQAARGCNIDQLADGLGLERPILGGFDWGGNASCVAVALWPERIGGRRGRSRVATAEAHDEGAAGDDRRRDRPAQTWWDPRERPHVCRAA
jgi:pimeloyl-ACP methyl ester carboxylesterase